MTDQPTTGAEAAPAAGQAPAARESTDYLSGFSDGYRAACAAHGVFDDAVAALAEQKPWQAVDTAAARRAAVAGRGQDRTPAQLRADAFASWGLTDEQPARQNERTDFEETGL